MQLAVVPQLFRKRGVALAVGDLRQRLAAAVDATVIDWLDPERIDALAEDLRVVHRRRLHHFGLIVCSLVVSALEHGADTHGRWLDAQATYRALGGADSGETSFREQVQKSLPVLRELLARRLRQIVAACGPELRGRLSSFADVLVPDGCAFKLAAALSGVHPGTGNAAELKLHAVYSLRAAGPCSVTMTAGSVQDSQVLGSRWQKDALYIWDLGFDSRRRFFEAAQAGAHVLQRLKGDANPPVLARYDVGPTVRLLARGDGSLKLRQAVQSGWLPKETTLDIDVQMRDPQDRRCCYVARVVRVRFASEDRFYLTTLPRERFTAYDVAELYRMRWEVERLFREWKGAVHIDDVRSLRSPASMQVAVYASLLAALFARDIHRDLEEVCRKIPEDEATLDAIPP
jgi:hypothetical protein